MSKGGRPVETHINWEEFDKLVSYQCTQKEIADFFGCSVDALDDACKRDLGQSLADVWTKRRAFGKIRLRKAQFAIVEKGGPGAATMAIYLDKKMFPEERPDLPPPPPIPPESGSLKQNVRTFEEFCEKAGYPKPFEKQKEMRSFGLDALEPRLLLGSRGYGKTDYVTILGVAYEIYKEWALGLPLKETNLIVTKSREKNAAMLGEISHALTANGVPLEKDNASCIRVEGLRGKDHSVSAVTIKTKSFRGRHPKRIILDDPVTEDDVSPATRKHVEKVYNELHKLTSNILIIGQPAHKQDLYAKLRQIVLKMEVPHGTIPELDHDLEAQRLAGVDEASIQASYFLTIPSDGSMPFENIRYLDRFPVGDSAVAFIDPSHRGGDFTALSIFKQYMDGVAVYGKVWKRAWNHCLDDMILELKKCNVKKVGFETNALGDQPIIMLRQGLVGLGVGVVGKDSTSNKHSRIMAAGGYAHLIHLSKESDRAYTDQVVQYEYNVDHDDAPDSLATGLEWIGLIRGKGKR